MKPDYKFRHVYSGDIYINCGVHIYVNKQEDVTFYLFSMATLDNVL